MCSLIQRVSAGSATDPYMTADGGATKSVLRTLRRVGGRVGRHVFPTYKLMVLPQTIRGL